MPPVGAAVAAIGGVLGFGGTAAAVGAGGLIGSGIVGTVVKLAAGTGLSFVARALAGTPDMDAAAGAELGTSVTMQSGGKVPRWFMLGRWATAGQIVYAGNWGNAGGTPNSHLVQVIALSHLHVEEVSAIWVDGEKVTYDNTANNTGIGQAIPQFRKDGTDHLWVKIYNGLQKIPDDYLVGKFPSGNRKWESTRIGEGVAYAIVTSRWNATLFGGAPSLVFETKGLRLYDPTKDSTQGGNDALGKGGVGHRWGNYSTYEWSMNPVVMLYNLMLGIRTHFTVTADAVGIPVAEGYEWVYGLQTVTQAQLPYSSWAAAINECNRVVTNQDGSTNTQFRAGAQIQYDTEPGTEMEELLKACDGRLIDLGGVYKIKVGPPTSAVMSFTDDSLMLTDDHSFDMFPTFAATVNAIQPTYVSPEEGWEEKDAKLREAREYTIADGRRRSIADVFYHRVFSKQQVQRLAKAQLLAERRFARFAVVLPPETYVIEPGDTVSWTSTEYGFTNKLFRVDGSIDRDDLCQGFSLTEVDAADWGWIPSDDEDIIFDQPMVTLRPPPQAIPGFVAAGVLLPAVAGGLATPVIRCNWTGSAAADDVDRIIFEVRAGSSSGFVVCREVSMLPEAGAYDISGSIQGGSIYAVRAQFGNPAGNRDFAWSNWVVVTTPATPIFMASLEQGIIDLIAQVSGLGKVITEQVLPPPAGISNMYRVTVYGTGINASRSSGYYLWVDTNGVPGILLDTVNLAIGNVTNRQYPFIIEGGVVKIARGHIQQLTADQIAANAITANHIQIGAITASEIADGIITGSKIAGGTIGMGNLAPNSVDGTKIVGGSIGPGKLGTNAVGSGNIVDASVIAGKLAALAVEAGNIKDGAIVASKIYAGAVVAGKLGVGAVLADNIAALQITAGKIATNQINAGHIVGGTISADKLVVDDLLEAKKITVKNIKGGEISTTYYSGLKASGIAQVKIPKKGGTIFIGTFTYKCTKEQTIKVAICKGGTKSPLSDATWRIDPGDDLNGAGQVVTMFDVPGSPPGASIPFDLLRIDGDGTVTNLRLLAMRVAP